MVMGNLEQLKDGRHQVGSEEQEFNLLKVEKGAKQPKRKRVNVVKRTNHGPRARLIVANATKRPWGAWCLYQALLNNMAQVDIIHGIGTGVIREGATKTLRRNVISRGFGYALKMLVAVVRL